MTSDPCEASSESMEIGAAVGRRGMEGSKVVKRRREGNRARRDPRY